MFSLLLAALMSSAAPHADNETKKLVHDAALRYDVRDFNGALPLYIKAYERSALPILLFNIGQCYKQLGEHERAVFYFGGFLRNSPESKHRALAETVMAESEAALRVAQAPRQLVQVAPRPAVMAALGTEAHETPPPLYKRWWFWGIIGGVVTATVVTTVAVAATAHPVPEALPGGSLGTVDRR
jgi:tetratricopeptide (TPR) repeat protein